jgi:hypothetical protein
MKSNGTLVYARQHKRGLTLPQQNAIDLLAAGKNDTEAAQLLGLTRVAVTKWRLYDPVFQAALNVRRAEVWGAGLDRLRSLIPKALDVLARELENADSPHRFKAAVEALKLAQLPADWAGVGPTEPDDVVRQAVLRERRRARDPLDDHCDGRKGLPPFDRHLQLAWRQAEARLTEEGPSDDPGEQDPAAAGRVAPAGP